MQAPREHSRRRLIAKRRPIRKGEDVERDHVDEMQGYNRLFSEFISEKVNIVRIACAAQVLEIFPVPGSSALSSGLSLP